MVSKNRTVVLKEIMLETVLLVYGGGVVCVGRNVLVERMDGDTSVVESITGLVRLDWPSGRVGDADVGKLMLEVIV